MFSAPICGLPYDPDPGGDAPPAERTAYQANREVRHTIIRLVGAHLRPEAAVSWQGLSFDFNGVIFDGGDFRGAEFPNGSLAVFDGAVFSGGTVTFGGAQFHGGEVNFSGSADWSHPPEFSWDGQPPTGVMLPVQPSGEHGGNL